MVHSNKGFVQMDAVLVVLTLCVGIVKGKNLFVEKHIGNKFNYL